VSKTAKVNPVDRLPDWRITLPLARASPRCGARTRRGSACKAPGMANGRCRLHGGPSTGPRTAEGLERMRRANTKHGRYTKENQQLMRLIRALNTQARRMAGEL